MTLTSGLELTLCDHDTFANGDPAWLLLDAIVVVDSDNGLIARAVGVFRQEPRIEHSARIHWSSDQVEQGLPDVAESIDPARFDDGVLGDGWSLVCTFGVSPRRQGSPTSATVRFLVTNAPHDRLRPGVELRLFERATHSYAMVEVVD